MSNPRDLARRLTVAVSRPCSRYHVNGLRCENTTSYADGWCRTGDCPGFTTPVPPDVPRNRWFSLRASSDPCPLDINKAATVGVTRTALERYQDAHSGTTPEQAEAAIRSLTEDLIAARRWKRYPDGWLHLAARGYQIMISPDLAVIVDYRTTHRERTWAQVRAGKTTHNRRRRFERRKAAITRAGLTLTNNRKGEGGRYVILTSPDGRTLRRDGKTLADLSAAQWQELTDQAHTELSVHIPIEEPS